MPKTSIGPSNIHESDALVIPTFTVSSGLLFYSGRMPNTSFNVIITYTIGRNGVIVIDYHHRRNMRITNRHIPIIFTVTSRWRSTRLVLERCAINSMLS